MARRYVIIGGGAIGAHLAAQLTEAGIPALVVARGKQLDALRQGPLEIEGRDGTRRVAVTVAAGPEEVHLTSGDVLAIATKTQDVEAAIDAWAWQPVDGRDDFGTGALAADLPILVLQNGVAAEALVQRRFARVISVATIVPVTYLEPGRITALSAPRAGYLQLGTLDWRQAEEGALAASIAADLERANYLVKLRTDITRRKHEKLLHNVSNGVDVLAGDAPERQQLAELLLAETRAVLDALGVAPTPPSPDEPDFAAALGLGSPGGGNAPPRRSTWQSFARGASSEVDFLNGEVVLLGRRLGIATPANAALQRVLGLSHARGEAPGTRRIADLLTLLDA
jgi:2-dehydropantoate 2-reductase